MTRPHPLLALAASLVIAPLQAHEPSQHAVAATTAATRATTAPKLDATLRDLWHGHVVHTREYAFAVKADDRTGAARAADAVVANAKQLSAAVASFYGEAAGKQMLTLLAGHWGAVKAMTDAVHTGDQAAAQQAMTALTRNADAIAAFLAGANPYLPADAVRGLLIAHGGHHAAQINQVMSGDLKGEATTWTAMQAHMNTIADALTGAIAKQFPQKVS